MTDAEKVIKALELCSDKEQCCRQYPEEHCPYENWLGDYEDSFYECTSMLAKDALAVLEEQKKLIEFQNNSLRSDADLISILNKKIQEIGEKPVLGEYGRCFLNALKRQLDMKLQFIEILTTPDFAEKIVELFETVFDC